MKRIKGDTYILFVVKILYSKKNILLLFLLYFLLVVYLSPIKSFAVQAKFLMITPYVFPFLLTDTSFLIIFSLGVIYYFSSIPFMNRWNGYYILRSGRKRWFFNQIKYIIISGIIITFITILLSNITLIPYWHIESGWGNVLYTLAKTDAKNLCNLFWELSSQFMSYNSPLKAMCISIIISSLGIIFIGILMFTCSLIFSRTISLIIINILVIYSSLIIHIRNVPQRILAMSSPISWMKIAKYGVVQYGYNVAPPLYFAICGYIILSLLLICLASYKVKRIDFIWRNEDE